MEFAVLCGAGACLSALCVWLGTSLHDGFMTAWLQVLGRKLLKQALWLVPAAMVAGVALHDYYSRMLRAGGEAMKAPGVILLAIPRAFAVFPLFGFLALLSIMAGFAGLCLGWARDRVLRRTPAAEAAGVMESVAVIPIWFILFPLMALQVENEGDMKLPVTVSRRRLLRWLVPTCFVLMMWTGMVGEDSGERVDPLWLTAFGAYWLGDYLLVALRVCPIVRARRGLTP